MDTGAAMTKAKKRVEYRWFVATPTLGLSGGIDSPQEALR